MLVPGRWVGGRASVPGGPRRTSETCRLAAREMTRLGAVLMAREAVASSWCAAGGSGSGRSGMGVMSLRQGSVKASRSTRTC